MGALHYLATLPRCYGAACGQWRAPCDALCLRARAAMAEASTECREQLRVAGEVDKARRGMACAEATTSPADLGPAVQPWHYGGAPRIPRARPLRLNAGSLDRHAGAMRPAPTPLPELLLAKGAMQHEPRKRLPGRIRMALRRLHNLLARLLLAGSRS